MARKHVLQKSNGQKKLFKLSRGQFSRGLKICVQNVMLIENMWSNYSCEISRRNVNQAAEQQSSLEGGGGHGGQQPQTLNLPPLDEQRLYFHPNCGPHATVINGALSAHRPNAEDDFNFGVVLTNRPLKTNEVFEVRLDKMVTKWAGSIEIGVTTHSPHDLEFPSTMTNVRSGTWMMTGNGVMHNGTTCLTAVKNHVLSSCQKPTCSTAAKTHVFNSCKKPRVKQLLLT